VARRGRGMSASLASGRAPSGPRAPGARQSLHNCTKDAREGRNWRRARAPRQGIPFTYSWVPHMMAAHLRAGDFGAMRTTHLAATHMRVTQPQLRVELDALIRGGHLSEAQARAPSPYYQ